MPDDLESRILAGQGLGAAPSSSPARSVASSPVNTDDELGSDLSDASPRSRSGPQHAAADSPSALPPRDGPQTGIKGVIKDAQQRKAIDRGVQRQRVDRTNAQLLSKALLGQTIDEEDAQRRKEREEVDDEGREEWRRKRERQMRAERQGETPRFGLREVGERTFVQAVERPGWVLVLVHEPDVPRCRPLLQSLVSLGRQLEGRSRAPLLLQGQATALSFSLLRDDRSAAVHADYEDDEEDDHLLDEEEDIERGPKRRADPDVLPSLLAYKDGELRESFIRVDWEAGADGAGLEDLLVRKGILTTSHTIDTEHSDDNDDDDDW